MARSFNNIRGLVVKQIEDFLERRGKTLPKWKRVYLAKQGKESEEQQGLKKIADKSKHLPHHQELTPHLIDKLSRTRDEQELTNLINTELDKARAIHDLDLINIIWVCQSTIKHANPKRQLQDLKDYIRNELKNFEGEHRKDLDVAYKILIGEILELIRTAHALTGKVDEHTRKKIDILTGKRVEEPYQPKTSEAKKDKIKNKQKQKIDELIAWRFRVENGKVIKNANNPKPIEIINELDKSQEKTVEAALQLGLQAMASSPKKHKHHEELVDLLQLLKTNVQNNEDYTTRGYNLGYPDDRAPDGPVSLFEGNKQFVEDRADWKNGTYSWDRIEKFALVYVSGKYDHTLLQITQDDGKIYYIHINGVHNPPEFLTEDDFYAYMICYGKVVDRIQQIPVPNMQAAKDKIKELCSSKWFHALVFHNCMTFAKRILRAGGADLSAIEGVPIPKTRLRDINPIYFNHTLWSNLKHVSTVYENLLRDKPIEEIPEVLKYNTQQVVEEASQDPAEREQLKNLMVDPYQFYAECTEYIILNMDDVYQWQVEVRKKKFKEGPPLNPHLSDNDQEAALTKLAQREAAYHLLVFLQDKILHTEWPRGSTFRYKHKVQGVDTVSTKKIPSHMIEMLLLFYKEKKNANPDYIKVINQVAQIGLEQANKNDSFITRFLRRRSEEAQKFYGLFKQSYLSAYEKYNGTLLSKEPKAKQPTPKELRKLKILEVTPQPKEKNLVANPEFIPEIKLR